MKKINGNDPATMKDLNDLETRIDTKFEFWSKDIVQTISDLFHSKFEENDRRWSENDKQHDQIMNSLDKILGKLENWETENTVGTEQIRKLRVKTDNHEKRITLLETA